MRLPEKGSATNKGVRTFMQALLALIIFAAASQDVRDLLTVYYPPALVVLPILAGAISAVQNVLDKDVPNY